ncbi:hypothetical protein HAX54_002749 [Datura stramonium]|uniref:Uncharacterized protein n=1 Tax=Datura stramonium TaxID=4076 RepID=A0ABS8T5L1_DATST|nr:hypothetical protein [Datura stramonium]
MHVASQHLRLGCASQEEPKAYRNGPVCRKSALGGRQVPRRRVLTFMDVEDELQPAVWLVLRLPLTACDGNKGMEECNAHHKHVPITRLQPVPPQNAVANHV